MKPDEVTVLRKLSNSNQREVFKKRASIVQYKMFPKILLAVDCMIFGFDGSRLKALLIKRNFSSQIKKWSLMGGFVNENESVDTAAKRILHELTGLTDIYMEQLHCFGDINRDPGGRVVSIAYFALVRINENCPLLMEEHNEHWIDINKLPRLIFDQQQMVEFAKIKLRQRITTHPVGFELLPERFTLQQLQNLYEAIYEKQFDKRNFAKKIFELNILKRLNEKEKKWSRKGSFYYVLDRVRYGRLEKEARTFI